MYPKDNLIWKRTCLLLLIPLNSCLYKVEETPVQQLHLRTDTLHPAIQNKAWIEDEFVQLVSQLQVAGFQIAPQDCEYPLDSLFCCQTPPADNEISRRIALKNQLAQASPRKGGNESTVQTSLMVAPNMQGLLEIKNCRIIAEQGSAGAGAAGASLEEWTFDSREMARKLGLQLRKFTRQEWQSLSVQPISWWRRKNRIYFILPDADLPQPISQRLREAFRKLPETP